MAAFREGLRRPWGCVFGVHGKAFKGSGLRESGIRCLLADFFNLLASENKPFVRWLG